MLNTPKAEVRGPSQTPQPSLILLPVFLSFFFFNTPVKNAYTLKRSRADGAAVPNDPTGEIQIPLTRNRLPFFFSLVCWIRTLPPQKAHPHSWGKFGSAVSCGAALINGHTLSTLALIKWWQMSRGNRGKEEPEEEPSPL